MRPRIQLTRVHQKNGPDYWQATCYIEDHSLETKGTTQQKALTKMYAAIDRVLYRDWYLAHIINYAVDREKDRETHLANTWVRSMPEELERTQNQLGEVTARSKDTHVNKKWSFWDWFK